MRVPSLTVVVGGQVDGFRPDGSEVRRHFQPQLVAVGLQRLDGAFMVDLQAGGALVAHLLARSLPLLHHITGQVSPPATETKGNKHRLFSPLSGLSWPVSYFTPSLTGFGCSVIILNHFKIILIWFEILNSVVIHTKNFLF